MRLAHYAALFAQYHHNIPGFQVALRHPAGKRRSLPAFGFSDSLPWARDRYHALQGRAPFQRHRAMRFAFLPSPAAFINPEDRRR